MVEDDDDERLSECTCRAELHRKVIAQAFWNVEVEEELRERRWLNWYEVFVGTQQRGGDGSSRSRMCCF